MKTFNVSHPVYFSIMTIAFAGLLASSCSSYKSNSYFDRDGIYVSNDQKEVNRNTQGNEYKDYFGSRIVDNDSVKIFTNVEDYSSFKNNIPQQNNDKGYNQGNPSWAGNATAINVNFYGNGFNNWGMMGGGFNNCGCIGGWNNWNLSGGFNNLVWSGGWNNCGWGSRFNNFDLGGGWNNWGWGVGYTNFGWNGGFNNFGWGDGFNDFYYGGGWNNGFNNNIVYSYGQRNENGGTYTYNDANRITSSQNNDRRDNSDNYFRHMSNNAKGGREYLNSNRRDVVQSNAQSTNSLRRNDNYSNQSSRRNDDNQNRNQLSRSNNSFHQRSDNSSQLSRGIERQQRRESFGDSNQSSPVHNYHLQQGDNNDQPARSYEPSPSRSSSPENFEGGNNGGGSTGRSEGEGGGERRDNY